MIREEIEEKGEAKTEADEARLDQAVQRRQNVEEWIFEIYDLGK